jgi:hypothetical protein
MDAIPIAIFWALLIWGLFSRGPLLLFVFFGTWSFGAFAAIPTAVTAGVTLTPMWITPVFIFLKIVLEEGPERVTRALLDPRKIGLLTFCGIYAVISAMFFPKLFAGAVDVFPMRIELEMETRPVPLVPTTANLTQTLYFLITIITCAASYFLCLRPNKLRQSLNAMLFGGVLIIITGVLDWVTGMTGTGQILEPFRTASYSLMTNAEMLNAKRIVGLHPEASAYAGTAVGFLAPLLFMRNAFRNRLTRDVWVPLVCTLLVGMVVMSTSSSGYVALIVLGATAVAHWGWIARQNKDSATTSVIVVYAGAVALLALVALRPEILNLPMDYFNEVVLRKRSSSSYAGRSMWNEVSLKAFAETWGLGVGLGGARASSWPVSVLANIGAVGAALMVGFISHVLLGRSRAPSPTERIMTVGIKFSFVPGLIVGALAQTSANIGLANAWMFGIVGALCWAPMHQILVAPQSAARFHKQEPQRQRARERALGRAALDPPPGQTPS